MSIKREEGNIETKEKKSKAKEHLEKFVVVVPGRVSQNQWPFSYLLKKGHSSNSVENINNAFFFSAEFYVQHIVLSAGYV